MPGPKPEPTAIRLIKGNPSKRPLPKNEPKPEAVKPKAPAHLSAEAKKHWRKTVKELYAANVMTRMDVDALCLYVEAYARWLDANEHLQKFGAIVKSPQGYPMQSPYLQISNKAFDQMRGMLTEFGMTPAARTKVATVSDKKDDADPWSSF